MKGRKAGTGAGPDLAALKALASDARLEELDRYVPPLSLPRAFGVARDEVAHSRVLTELLDPGRHREGRAMLAALLREMASRPGLDALTAAVLREAAQANWTRVAVHRERLLIDVVVEVSWGTGALVLGIENKLDAGEQPNQLARYQASLARAYPGRTAMIAFLTPTGRDPTTAHEGGPVPVVALGYSAILSAVGEARDEATTGSREERTLSELEAHLKEEILGEPGEAKTMARELWRTHGRALRLAMEHRPGMGDISENLVGLLRERFGADANVYLWPERGTPREIKLDLSSWFERGFPFTFMLHDDSEGRPYVRVLAYRDNYLPHARALAEWAPKVNMRVGHLLIDERFSRISRWGWHKVLLEEDYPPGAVLEEDAYDGETARAGFEAMVGLIELLRPHVDGRPGGGPA